MDQPIRGQGYLESLFLHTSLVHEETQLAVKQRSMIGEKVSIAAVIIVVVNPQCKEQSF